MDRLVPALDVLELNSPRGPVQLEAESHEIIQWMYQAEVKKESGKLVNVVGSCLSRVGNRTVVTPAT